jgi:hypothetical protein
MSYQIYFNTLDIDTNDKEKIDRIMEKIKSNPCCYSIHSKPSSTKGVHIIFRCVKKCDVCRLVFDDMKRYEIDFNREEKFKNVVFTDKEFFRGNMNTIKESCDRCRLHNKNITLTKRDLTYKQVVAKMIKGKMTSYEPTLIYMEYIYLECPICGWFKFVKSSNFKKVQKLIGKKE